MPEEGAKVKNALHSHHQSRNGNIQPQAGAFRILQLEKRVHFTILQLRPALPTSIDSQKGSIDTSNLIAFTSRINSRFPMLHAL